MGKGVGLMSFLKDYRDYIEEKEVYFEFQQDYMNI